MPEAPKCPECGAELPPDGVCVQCALGLALDTAQAPPAEPPAAPSGNRTMRVDPPADLPNDQPGEKIGPYKLLQLIGEGGMGSVWMAEQQQPFRRVALKLVKLGMDTKQVVARFRAEQEALARMDHPNIARVFDVGTTENGRPYFVMELVRGIPITTYCDKEKLSTLERLNLFIQVCHAIQHAHQKGIIHRDIKPSNILVTMLDGVPVPKVIDFGIAKATQGKLVDETLFTAFEQFIGTPAYMSPEQAEMTALDIDTRSDIYSLGVLLYELLSGRTPFDTRKLLEAGLDEIRRIIREEEPPRPSTRLSTLEAVEQTTVARQRHAEPPKLLGLIRGDLDWIVMKCLEKDRRRRYETANGLAMDIERHLSNEPVVARPPSNLYRLQKLVRRNKLAFAAGTSVIAALVLGMGTASWMYLRESQARQRALEAERTQAHLREQADRASEIANENAQRAQKALDNALRSGDRAVIDGAVEDYKAFVQQSADNSSLRAKLAGLYQLQAEVYWKRSQDGTLGSEQRENTRAIATAAIQESCRLLEELTQTFPKNAQHAESLADGHALFARLADTENQTFHLSKALGLLELLNKQQPDAWRLQLKLANLLRQSAEYSSDPEELRRFARAELDYRERAHLRAHQEETDGVVMHQLAEELSLTYEAAARLHENESEAGIYAEKAARIFRTLMAQRETNGLAADMAAGLLRLASLDRQWVAVLQQRGALGEAAKAGRQWILDLERHQAHDENAAARMIEEAYSTIAPLFETISISASDRIALTTRLGKEATIEGKISEAVWSSTGYVLNIDFEGTEHLPMKQRLLAVVFRQDSDSIASVLGGEVATVLTGRLVRLQGKLQRYRGRVVSWAGRPQIVVAEPRQIALIRRSLATPTLPEPPYPELSQIIHAGDLRKIHAAIGRKVTVEGRIQTAEWSASGAVLNIEFHDARNGLLAVIFQKEAANIGEALGGDLERILPGKTVQVRGQLETYGGQSPRFTDRPQIIIRDAAQLSTAK